MTSAKIHDIMGAAYVLPATTGIVGLLLLKKTDPIVVTAMLIVSAVSLLVLFGSISRYLLNTFKNK